MIVVVVVVLFAQLAHTTCIHNPQNDTRVKCVAFGSAAVSLGVHTGCVSGPHILLHTLLVHVSV